MSTESPQPDSGADLLEHLLGSLLADFRFWFERGELLLDHCPETLMGLEQQQSLRQRLEQAGRELTAATSLRRAAPVPMALGLDAMGPWHQLVVEVWSLARLLRAHQVSLPQWSWPEPPRFPG
ncbi:MAG: DUF2605 family protein [Cyanobium sp.]|nr:DUF2605 family protein [Cyanobium sp.]